MTILEGMVRVCYYGPSQEFEVHEYNRLGPDDPDRPLKVVWGELGYDGSDPL